MWKDGGLINSLYFSVVTLTTVGYGDFFPVTSIGKLFTIFYIFIGIGLILVFINKVAKAAWENQTFQELLYTRKESGLSRIRNFKTKKQVKNLVDIQKQSFLQLKPRKKA